MVTKNELNKMQRLVDNIKKYCDESISANIAIEHEINDGAGNLAHLTNVTLEEAGHILSFTIWWMNGTVYIEEDSDSAATDCKTMTFDEFFKFQHYFVEAN